MTTTKDLLRMKEQITEAKENKAKAEGRLQQLMKELKSKFGCNTLVAAQKKMKTLDANIDKKVAELDKGIEQLKESYEWE